MAKKSKLRRRIKRFGRALGRVASVAAPAAGALFGGVGGAALGTLGGTGASVLLAGGKKAKRRALRRGLTTGAAITGGTAALGLISGAGIGSSVVGSVGRIFGPSTPAVPTPGGSTGLEDAFGPLEAAKAQQEAAGGSGFFSDAAAAYRLLGGTAPNGQTAGPRPDGDGFFGGQEGSIGGGGSSPGMANGVTTEGGFTGPVDEEAEKKKQMLWIAGGLLLAFLLLRKKT